MILVGTSGWSYPTGRGTWNGIFYPARRHRGFDELAYYAERFDTVEVNSTFYRPPEPATTAAWARRTPAAFRFSVKLYQKFTHPDMYLARPGAREWDLSLADVDQFRIGIEPLASAGKLAAVLAQFPPSFHRAPETAAYLDWLLRALAGYDVAVELRHRSWSDHADDTSALLAPHGAALALIDEPKFRDSIRQSWRPPHGRLTYIRLHGRNAARWWDHDESEDRYDYLYSPEELSPFAAAAREAEQGADEAGPPSRAARKVLAYMNNHFSAKAVANAAVLRHQLGQVLPADYLPEMVARYPQLAGLVTTAGLPL